MHQFMYSSTVATRELILKTNIRSSLLPSLNVVLDQYSMALGA